MRKFFYSIRVKVDLKYLEVNGLPLPYYLWFTLNGAAKVYILAILSAALLILTALEEFFK